MPAKQLDDIFSPGADVLGTRQDARHTILAQTGDAVGETVDCDDAEVWGPIGYAARPAKAIAGKSACQAITLNSGSTDVAIAFRDLRGSSIHGPIGPGEVCIYAAGPDNSGVSRLTLRNDGSATAAELEAALVKLGAGATDGVVVGDSAFLAWAQAITAAVRGTITAVATTSAVNGSPLNPGAAALDSGLDFPSGSISSVVKGAK